MPALVVIKSPHLNFPHPYHFSRKFACFFKNLLL